MRILVIEDDEKAAAYLAKGLGENGCAVDVANDGVDGAHLAETSAYDVVICDVMLPGRDGFSIVEQLRRGGKRCPILFLSARDSIEDRVKGLDLGADDYLVKPFAFSELLARVRSLARRGTAIQPELLVVGDLAIDTVRRRATRAGQRLDLTPKEFSLLTLLARRKGEVLSRTLISEQVWDMNFDSSTNVVDVHIRRLRSKVDDPFEKKLIQTARGAGYVLDDRP